jgi:hypothetical protein
MTDYDFDYEYDYDYDHDYDYDYDYDYAYDYGLSTIEFQLVQIRKFKPKMEASQGLTVASDFADVTLASQHSKPEQVFCKFHQRGHCKFGKTCNHFHTQYTCTSTQCEDDSCTARHPRHCVYYTRTGFCKFGSSCSYRHQVLSSENTAVKHLESEITMLKETLTKVLAALQNKENEIKVHEQRITGIESIVKTSSGETFQCTQCDYESSTSTALKTHVTKKHKSERLRESREKDLEVSLTSCEERADEPSPSSSPCTLHNIAKYTCEMCLDTFTETDDFKKHMIMYHKFKDSTKTCCLCVEHFPFLPTYPRVGRKGKEVEVMCSPCYEDATEYNPQFSWPLFQDS